MKKILKSIILILFLVQGVSAEITTKKSCNFDGLSVPTGSSTTAFQTSMVSDKDNCVFQQRVCTNGRLSGTFRFSSCTKDKEFKKFLVFTSKNYVKSVKSPITVYDESYIGYINFSPNNEATLVRLEFSSMDNKVLDGGKNWVNLNKIFSPMKHFQWKGLMNGQEQKFVPVLPITLTEYRDKQNQERCIRYQGSVREGMYFEDKCPGKIYTIPQFADSKYWKRYKGTWVNNKDGSITVKLPGNMTYQWINRDGIWRSVDNTLSSTALIRTNFDGYGFFTDNLSSIINASNLYNIKGKAYKGEMIKQNTSSTTAIWPYKEQAVLESSAYNISDATKKLTEFDGYSTSFETCWTMGVHHALLFNIQPNLPQLFYRTDGHDYNYNGCYDEPSYGKGHQQINMAIMGNDNKIDKIIFLEYSPERDLSPIMSIGYYKW